MITFHMIQMLSNTFKSKSTWKSESKSTWKSESESKSKSTWKSKSTKSTWS
jgi:hypothetical protein